MSISVGYLFTRGLYGEYRFYIYEVQFGKQLTNFICYERNGPAKLEDKHFSVSDNVSASARLKSHNRIPYTSS